MRGKLAKQIRKSVYGDNAQRPTMYGRVEHTKYGTRKNKEGKLEGYFYNRDTVVCLGLRRLYKHAKKEVRKG